MTNEHFDARASTWDDDPTKHRRAEQVAAAIIASADLTPVSDPASTKAPRLLEVGAGTGLVAAALRGHVGAVTLADTSQGMIDVMRAKAGDPHHPLSGATIVHDDLLAGPLGTGRGVETITHGIHDLVVAVLVLHHVSDPAAAIERLAAHLAAGGALAVVDLDSEDGSFHDHDFDGHHGFDRAAVTRWFEQAGLQHVTVTTAGEIIKERGTFTMLLATGRRPG